MKIDVEGRLPSVIIPPVRMEGAVENDGRYRKAVSLHVAMNITSTYHRSTPFIMLTVFSYHRHRPRWPVSHDISMNEPIESNTD